MSLNYLHNHPDFSELIRVGEERSIDPALIAGSSLFIMPG